MTQLISHYDKLVEEGNDPVRDPQLLRDYMDKWDGQPFVDALHCQPNHTVLEIGVGTGRLAQRVAPFCMRLIGIDISPKSIERARENLLSYRNIELICADFINHDFREKFNRIYSSLTFMHIADKPKAFLKIARLLNDGGLFVLSTDKNQSEWIDMGDRKLRIYPDIPEQTEKDLSFAGFCVERHFETEFAHIFVAKV